MRDSTIIFLPEIRLYYSEPGKGENASGNRRRVVLGGKKQVGGESQGRVVNFLERRHFVLSHCWGLSKMLLWKMRTVKTLMVLGSGCGGGTWKNC